MSFLPKAESLSVKESSEQQLDSVKQWVDRIELPDDSAAWQNSIELPEDMSDRATTPAETRESDDPALKKAGKLKSWRSASTTCRRSRGKIGSIFLLRIG